METREISCCYQIERDAEARRCAMGVRFLDLCLRQFIGWIVYGPQTGVDKQYVIELLLHYFEQIWPFADYFLECSHSAASIHIVPYQALSYQRP